MEKFTQTISLTVLKKENDQTCLIRTVDQNACSAIGMGKRINNF